MIEGGGTVVQETRLYDSDKDQTRSMRSKEEAMDYRYFPDPDLPPLVLSEDFIREVEATLPELPDAKRVRFMSQYGLNKYDAGVLTGAREMADYYEAVVKQANADPKIAANWIAVELSGFLNRDNKDIAQSTVTTTMMAGLLKRLADNTISGKIAKEVLEAMWAGEGNADAVIEKKDLKQITDSGTIEKAIDEAMAKNQAVRAVPRRQGNAVRIFRRPGNEGHAGQGQSRPGQRTAEEKARPLTHTAARCVLWPCLSVFDLLC